ncbi:MAG: hypothetical protein GXO47_01265, partial [Chlorobi bacterium]|nr:hypothetical protein [Chlorobiota bacterium]
NIVSLPQSDTTKIYVFTSNGKTLSIDKQLNVTGTIDFEDLSIYYLQIEKHKFIANDKITWIINDEGQKIAEINMTTNAFLIGKTLYDKQNNSFITIDLSDIFKYE